LFRALLHFLAFAAAVAPAFAQVYKWVDERGVTHYGERPPQGAKATEVRDKLASPPPTRSGGDAAKDQREAGHAASKDGGAPPKPPPTLEQVKAANRQSQCEQQRAILARLKESPPSYTLNGKGEKVPTDNAEVIAQQETRVIEQCRN
jgi:hypothetical protein